MPPLLALLFCLCLVAWLFWRDIHQRQFASPALWIPFVWLGIIGSRPVSYWFGGGGDSGGDWGGSPINTLVLAVLIGGAIVVLMRRNCNWAALVQNNKALCLIYLFFAVSAAWSPLGVIALKRLLKDFGTVLVGLILLTELDPPMAIRAVFVRVSYLLFPLSILVNRYFPAISRNYTSDGGQMFTGLTTQKNSLGEMVVVFGLMVLWDLLEMRRENDSQRRNTGILIRVGLLLLGVWLMLTCNSATSMICFLLGGFILWAGSRLILMKNGRHVLVCCLLGLLALASLNGTFHFTDTIAAAVGRNPNLTGRTEIWQDVLEQHTNPLIGCGFYSFWDSVYGKNAWGLIGVPLNEAHNGFLEIYLDGGWIGVALLVVLLLATGSRAIRSLFEGRLYGRMAFAFWLIAIFYNNSESNFFRLGMIWFTFLLLTTEIAPQLQEVEDESDFENAGVSAYGQDS